MLREGFDVYVPLVDDRAVDAVVRRNDGKYIELQIKARSANVKEGDAGLFAAIDHEHRPDYWFVFYSERLQTTWIMSSAEFLKECAQNRTGKTAGLRSVWFNGRKLNRQTGNREEYVKPKFRKYVATDFSRLITKP